MFKGRICIITKYYAVLNILKVIPFNLLLNFIFYNQNGDLKKVINDKKNSKSEFTKEEIVYFSRDILKGLEYLHSNNMVHRDLKPGYFLFNKNLNQLKLN